MTAVTGFLSACAAKVAQFMTYVAEKMFGTPIVQGTASLIQTSVEYAADFGVKVLEATEGCIDKGTKAVVYVAKKLRNWLIG